MFEVIKGISMKTLITGEKLSMSALKHNRRIVMKAVLLVLVFLVQLVSFPQTSVPKAGEVSKTDLNQRPQVRSIMFDNTNVKDITVLDFDSLNTMFTSNFPFADSYSLSLSEEGDIAFVGSGGGIFVTDITDPENPRVISKIRTRSLVDFCRFDSQTKRLYVCAYFSGIEIWDLTVIENPVRMSRIPTEPYPRWGIDFMGDYLFVTTDFSVYSIDISDPYHPSFMDELNLGTDLLNQQVLNGNLLYVETSSQGLKLIDVSDPSNLTLSGSSSYLSGARFCIQGDYLYGVTSSSLKILNISDPGSISFAGSLPLTGYPQDLAVQGNIAYVARMSTDGGMQTIDISNPSSPVDISIYPGNFQHIKVNSNYVYLTFSSEFTILDASDSSAVTYKGGFEMPGFVSQVTASGNYLYAGSNGLRVIDISDSTHPVQTGYLDLYGDLTAMAGDSLLIYCPLSMGASNNVYTINVSDPSDPQVLDNFTCPVMTVDLAVKGNLVFVACWWDGVRVFDISDPSNIVQIAHTMGWTQGGIPGETFCYAQAIAVEGNYLYIVDYGPFSEEDTYGLYILDVSDPANPVLANRFQGITGHPVDIAVKGTVIYSADGYGGVEAIDVSDPLNPSSLSYVNLPDGATGITVEDNFAYASNYIMGGVEVMDIKDPADMQLTGWYKPSGCFALSAASQEGRIFIADGLGGIQIYRNLLVTPPISVAQDAGHLSGYELSSNYPNPFNPSTVINYQLPEAGNVELKIYDVLGREVAVLVNGFKNAGHYSIRFDGKNFAAGVYIYRLKAGSFTSSRKMLLLK